jgi:parallel beta-helix repeat protein
MHGLMTTQYQPGDWNDTNYGRKVSGVMYAVNKFFVGDTRENDQNIEVYHATDTTIEGNTITEGLVGIELRESQRTRILGNTISHHAAQGIWAYEGGEAEVAHNLFLDNDHHMRVQMNAGPPKKLYIYANRFHQAMAGDSAKHIHLSFVGCAGQSCSSSGIVAVYHNSFAGGGWAVDLGGTNEGRKDTPGLQILNNLLSVRGLSSGGYHSTGEVQTKLTAPLWRSDSVPTFVLPAGHAGRNSAPSLIGKLPGMTSAYIGDGKPNYGALQEGTSTPGSQSPPAEASLPIPKNLRVIGAE